VPFRPGLLLLATPAHEAHASQAPGDQQHGGGQLKAMVATLLRWLHIAISMPGLQHLAAGRTRL
jgi:hypothetical protein